jgi:hypothetical protein
VILARRPATFRQHDVTRALRAARAAGLEVTGYEIEPTTGKIVVTTAGRASPPSTPDAALEQWLANHARKA